MSFASTIESTFSLLLHQTTSTKCLPFALFFISGGYGGRLCLLLLSSVRSLLLYSAAPAKSSRCSPPQTCSPRYAPLGHLNAPSNNGTQLRMLMILSLVQFESKSSRAKGIAFHPKRSVTPAEGHLTPQSTHPDLKTGHGFSSPFTPLPSNCGTTAWELLSTDSKNTMAQFAALTSTQPSPCLCREVTTTRSRFGTTRPGGVCSH